MLKLKAMKPQEERRRPGINLALVFLLAGASWQEISTHQHSEPAGAYRSMCYQR